MKLSFAWLPFVLLVLLTSCFGDEPLNMECDITEVEIVLDNPGELFYNVDDRANGWGPVLEVSSVLTDICYTVRSVDLVGERPVKFKITENSKIEILEGDADAQYQPFQNGGLVDFSGGQTRYFRVTSEDGDWNRTYSISFVQKHASLVPCSMNIEFADYNLNDPQKTVNDKGVYYVWEEYDANAIQKNQWATGNPGFKLSMSSAKAPEYPTVAVADGGVDGGSCLKLETKDTGPFGRMVNMRIAAGSFFIGTFDVKNALKNALAATRFGLPFAHKPTKMSGYYKFKAGEKFQNKDGKEVVGRVDQPDAYCVVYRNVDAEGNAVLLDGADVLSNPNIVGIARISGVVETDEWTHFEIPMEYTEEIDDDLLVEYGYNMTICFSSSIDGAYFEGAPGSTFYVDKVTLECEY
ncbi:MAG: PCMD domain-containing protein [Bacteroidaceae bacterium]|nr:PCMD domain-containing protein [Bacteroidaceae bacterium]